jgi:hypothetical protein
MTIFTMVWCNDKIGTEICLYQATNYNNKTKFDSAAHLKIESYIDVVQLCSRISSLETNAGR